MDIKQEALAKARAKQAKMRAEGKYSSAKPSSPIEKAQKNPTSLRMAINAKCWDCIGAGADPKPQWNIGNCVCPDCPLYPVRPYQRLFDDSVDPTRPYNA